MSNRQQRRNGLQSVPQIGGGVDLAEREAMKEGLRIKVIMLPVREGTLVTDKRLAPPAVVGQEFMWMLSLDDIENADPPLIFPHFEK